MIWVSNRNPRSVTMLTGLESGAEVSPSLASCRIVQVGTTSACAANSTEATEYQAPVSNTALTGLLFTVRGMCSWTAARPSYFVFFDGGLMLTVRDS